MSARFTFSPQKLTDSLLCSHFELLVGIKDSLDRAFKNHALVEYALAGMDNRLFVSKYQLKLPKKEEISRFLEKQMKFGINKGQS
ncbi:MAG: hypothetical protein HY747_11250 [Elusimicrobia bacterium]|nr:hypothetical protein [Elusimicrobiota bacterium]